DPHIPVIGPLRSWPELAKLESAPISPLLLGRYAAVVIATDHTQVDYEMLAENAKLIVDARGVYRKPRPNVIKA
ncbi:MAG TPA: nucleotide sugar dehydrogenase, partial [Polyangiaceae bacterium]|nr:nucleotide sugar dehydrogenase [Polyangiaceae bacterium]